MNRKSLIPWGKNEVSSSRTNGLSTALGDEQSPFLALHRQMNRLFDDFFRDIDLPLGGLSWPSNRPHIEIAESDTDYKVVAELPGLDDKDVEVTLEDGVLTLKGEKKGEASEEKNGGHYSERWFGKFERSFDLGSDVDADKVRAAFQKGILTVVVGKRPDARSRVKRITVARE